MTFGFIGRITEEKGIDNLMRSSRYAATRSIRMMIAGRLGDQRTAAPEDTGAGCADRVHGDLCRPTNSTKQVDVVDRSIHLARSRPARRR